MNSKTLPLLATAALLLAPLNAAAASAQEIELHIEALGDALPRSARVEFEIQSSAESPEAAERGIAVAKAELTRKFADIGIKPQQITFGEVRPSNLVPAVAVEAMPIAAPSPTASRSAESNAAATSPPPVVIKPAPAAPRVKDYKRVTVSITLDDLGKLDAVKAKARDFSNTSYRSPTVVYMQRDPAAARDEAVAKAIAQARVEADRYGGAMGYKVVRVVRVSNAKPVLNVPDLMQFISSVERRTGDSERLMATVWAGVAIDFVIAPK